MLRKSKRLLVGLAVLLAGCISVGPRVCDTNKYSPIVRLKLEGRDHCTAFVISDKHAVTAAHCVEVKMSLGPFGTFKKPYAKSFVVANSMGDKITEAETVGANHRIDYALLEGDFTRFKRLEPDFSNRVYRATKLSACGYPQGSKDIECSKMIRTGTRYFQVKASGELVFGGHSGGPVIDKLTGKVVGIISAVYEDGILFAPVQPMLMRFKELQ